MYVLFPLSFFSLRLVLQCWRLNDQPNLNADDFQLKFYENVASKLVMKVDLCCCDVIWVFIFVL